MVWTDHYSLKYLLEQRISSPAQQRWVTKLLGFDFRVEYKKGRTNLLADALSHIEVSTGQLVALSMPHCDLLTDIQKEHSTSDELQGLIQLVLEGAKPGPWDYKADILLYKKKITFRSIRFSRTKLLPRCTMGVMRGIKKPSIGLRRSSIGLVCYDK